MRGKGRGTRDEKKQGDPSSSASILVPRPWRLFFAIWPDDGAREKLALLAAEMAGQAGGKPVPAEKIHLTLEFLGDVAADRVQVLERIARKIRAPGFLLRFDRTGSFRRARVGWVGADAAPAELFALQSKLSRALAGEGFALEDRPYSPHVTLARGIERSVPRRPIEAIAWMAAAFSLVRSEPGKGGYTTLASWPLG